MWRLSWGWRCRGCGAGTPTGWRMSALAACSGWRSGWEWRAEAVPPRAGLCRDAVVAGAPIGRVGSGRDWRPGDGRRAGGHVAGGRSLAVVGCPVAAMAQRSVLAPTVVAARSATFSTSTGGFSAPPGDVLVFAGTPSGLADGASSAHLVERTRSRSVKGQGFKGSRDPDSPARGVRVWVSQAPEGLAVTHR